VLTAPVLPCASGAVYLHFVGRAAGCKDLLLAALLELAWLGDHCPGELRRDLEDIMPDGMVFTPRTQGALGTGSALAGAFDVPGLAVVVPKERASPPALVGPISTHAACGAHSE